MVNGVEMMGELVTNNARIIYLIYMVCRIIGRLAFPIFSFMIVEGFLHTCLLYTSQNIVTYKLDYGIIFL